MHIEEHKGVEDLGIRSEETFSVAEDAVIGRGDIVVSDAKRILIGAGARALFYPTLLYNILRNKLEEEFRWWDWIDEFVLLGAIPFPADVERLKELGIRGVITLNEPYETLVPTSLYQAHGIDHLVLPTRDYAFAPSLKDICQAVEFIQDKASRGKTTYVHCKAGRGRSTTIVICYLVEHKQMMPDAAYDYVKSIRPRVLLASSQWQAVQEYYHCKVKKTCKLSHKYHLVLKAPRFLATTDLVAFDDCSMVVVTEADLDGYDPSHESSTTGGEVWANLSIVCRVCVAGHTALARLSCLWFRCSTDQKICNKKLNRGVSSSTMADDLSRSIDIHLYPETLLASAQSI